MSNSNDFLERLKAVEQNIAETQDDIDNLRAAYPYDNVIQLQLDRRQAVLNSQKKEVREAKEEYSRLYM